LPIKKIISNLFQWQPSRETLIAVVAGFVAIGLSAAMIPTRHILWLSILIRDLGQIFVMGILFPLVYILHTDNRFGEFGLTLKRWYIFLPINLVLGALLLLMFLSESPPPADFHVTAPVVWKGAFVIVAVFFELIFFYGFLRTLFEKTFGIVPGIILAALFYSFHHMGFQPEYGKLFFVGLLYALVYRWGNSALLLYPFFLGVGGTYDVLIQSHAVSPIQYPEIRTAYLFILILAAVLWTWKKTATSGLLVSRKGTRPSR
jgi:membrane protease YdiL (CAAX protease family)